MDLLLETEKLEWLVQHVDAKNFGRTCLYLVSCCAYLPEGDDKAVLQTAYDIYSKQGQDADALRIALKMNDMVCTLAGPTATLLQHAIPPALTMHPQSRWEIGIPVKSAFIIVAG